MAEQKKQLLIVTGMSGAGKTVAIKVWPLAGCGGL